jgi:hypothetical protein
VTKPTGMAVSVLWAVACSLLGPANAFEVPHSSREDQLKAGYIFNFAKFVDWPNLEATDTLTICFLGGAGIREAFAASSAGKQVGSHPVVARAVAGKSAPGCHLLFIAADSAAPDGMNDTSNSAVLAVGEEHDFIRKGGIIELFTENNRLRFNINLDNARRVGLKISSSLLQLATRVEEAGR